MAKSRRTIIYHAGCKDGFCAAWLNWRARRNPDYFDDLYIAASYGDEPPDVTDQNVVIFDFSYPREQLLEMHEQAASLRVFDHHKTAQAALEGLDFCTFDMNKSGARLAQEWLYDLADRRRLPGRAPSAMEKYAGSWLVDYVEDRDLWKWELPNSKEMNAAIDMLAFDFEEWEEAYLGNPQDMLIKGTAIREYQLSHIKKVLDRDPVFAKIGGYIVPIIQILPTFLVSEMVGELAKKFPGCPFAAGVWLDVAEGDYVYSLRSRGGDVDVGVVAKDYGGGGHPQAAGFRTDKPLPMSTAAGDHFV